MKPKSLLIILVLLQFWSCNPEAEHPEKALAEVIEKFESHKGFDREEFPLGVFTEDYFKAESDFAMECLGELKKIDPVSLSESDQISSELLKFKLQNTIDYYVFGMYLNPLLSDSGFHTDLVYQVKPLNNYNETRNYLKVLNDIPRFVDEHFTLLEKGLERGTSQPRVIFNGYESSYDMHVVEDFSNSFFYGPFKHLPTDLSQQQRDSVLAAARSCIEKTVVPQFKRVKDFFENKYLPNTRISLGISTVPNGIELYQNRIDYYTTSEEFTAKSIHDMGMTEVERIRNEMNLIIEELGFEGSYADFLTFLRTDGRFYPKSKEELMMIARDIAKRADAELPRFFITLPRKPYGVAPVPDAIAPKYTGGRYVGPGDQSAVPGYYWVNTYDLPSRTLYTLPALTAHEAVPGHHLQISLTRELGDSIPEFRRNMYLSAYGEGWGLYAEYLAEEMGLYTTPYERFGQLTYEMWRACRLVVDTGIHAFGWSRAEAVDFMRTNTALSLHEIETETDRYISWPGQALSYKIGELKIRELRNKAERLLESNFDIREFHEVILEQGTVTLPRLETRVDQYIDKKKNGT